MVLLGLRLLIEIQEQPYFWIKALKNLITVFYLITDQLSQMGC